MSRSHLVAVLLAVVAMAPAAEAKTATKPAKSSKAAEVKAAQKKLGANATVAFGKLGELVSLAVDADKKKTKLSTPEEEAATQIQKLLRSNSLRKGVTGLFVVDARTGEPLFAVNHDEALNPASNVKMVSTATALELLGPDFRYPTRLLGSAPVNGVVHGDLYLLGSYDPTLTSADMDELAASLALRGVHSIEGNIVVGADPTRDGIFRSTIPIEIIAGEVGEAPTVIAPPNYDLVTVTVTATTTKKKRGRLTYKAEVVKTDAGLPRIELTVGGTISKGKTSSYTLWTKQRTANAAYSLIAALKARAISVTGDMKVGELGDFVGESLLVRGALPVEMARHESLPLADIVAKVNKRSINWLADRVVMTGAALARRTQPSMQLALDEMYAWLARHPHLDTSQVVLDTGSGLSYKTKITPAELVSVVRSAGGYAEQDTPGDALAAAWRSSLSVAGSDGTLRHRFKTTEVRGHVYGKTGTLRTVIALSGILDIDPTRPLAFSLVTNAEKPLDKKAVRRIHEQMLGEVCHYLARTAKPTTKSAPIDVMPTTPVTLEVVPTTDEPEETDPDTAELDEEAATSN